jgi:hypothetical protein
MEMYEESRKLKSKPVKLNRTSSLTQMAELYMIGIFTNAEYIIKKKGARE